MFMFIFIDCCYCSKYYDSSLQFWIFCCPKIGSLISIQSSAPKAFSSVSALRLCEATLQNPILASCLPLNPVPAPCSKSSFCSHLLLYPFQWQSFLLVYHFCQSNIFCFLILPVSPILFFLSTGTSLSHFKYYLLGTLTALGSVTELNAYSSP